MILTILMLIPYIVYNIVKIKERLLKQERLNTDRERYLEFVVKTMEKDYNRLKKQRPQVINYSRISDYADALDNHIDAQINYKVMKNKEDEKGV